MHSTPTRLRMGPPTIFDARARSAQVRSSSLPQESAAPTATEHAADPAGQAFPCAGPDRCARSKRIAQTRPVPLRSGCRHHQDPRWGPSPSARCFGTLRHFVPVRGKITGHLPYPEPPTAWHATATRPLPSIRRLARCVLGGKHGEERGCTKGQRKRGVKRERETEEQKKVQKYS